MKTTIAFIGAGSMAEAIISGITASGLLKKEDIWVTNKDNQERLKRLQQNYGVKCISNKENIHEADIVILATKPMDMKEAIASIRDYLKPEQLIISVIAGISIGTITGLIGKNMAVIRAMPNTSAAMGASATAISAGKDATNDHLRLADELFKTIGTTAIIKEEAMHTVTAVSGSGPAYIYYLVEAMESAAVELGLDHDIAKSLIIQTVVGAGEMLKKSGDSANILREKITSPAGTTDAGIKTLEQHHFKNAVQACVENARNRSIELGKVE